MQPKRQRLLVQRVKVRNVDARDVSNRRDDGFAQAGWFIGVVIELISMLRLPHPLHHLRILCDQSLCLEMRDSGS